MYDFLGIATSNYKGFLYLTGFMGKLSSPHQTRSTARSLQSPLRTQTSSPVRIFHMFTFLSAVPTFLISTRCPPHEPLLRFLYWNGGEILKALLSTMTHLLLVQVTCFWPTSVSIKQKSENNEGTPQVYAAPLDPQPLHCSTWESGTGELMLSPALDSDLYDRSKRLKPGLFYFWLVALMGYFTSDSSISPSLTELWQCGHK